MKALIPAAGMATRLRPLTLNCPKCLLPIGNQCLMGRILDALKAVGICDVIITLGYLGDQIKAFVRDNYSDMNVIFIENPLYETTNNIYSLYLMRKEAEGEDVILLDSDIVFDPSILNRLIENPAPNTLALSRHPLGDEEIKVIIDAEGYVREIGKTCTIETSLGESTGIEKMSSSYTSALYSCLEQMIEREGQSGVFYEFAFERLAKKGICFTTTDITDLFAMELDTVEDFQLAGQTIPQNLV